MNKRKVVLAAAIFAALGTNVSFAALEIGDNSIAEGNQAIATGSNSIAVGTNAVATGDNLTGDVIKQKLAENQAQLAEIERLTKLVNDGTLEFNQKYAIYNRVKAAQEKIAANNELINNTLRPNYDTAKGNYDAFKPEYDETVRQMNERLAYINKLNFSLLTTDPNGLETLATELKTKSEEGFPQVNNDIDFYKTYIQNYIKAKGDLENIKSDSSSRYNSIRILSNNYSKINTNGVNLIGLDNLYSTSSNIEIVKSSNSNYGVDADSLTWYTFNAPSLDDTAFNAKVNKATNDFDFIKTKIENLPLEGYITADVKNNMLEALKAQKEKHIALYNAKHEQYLYEQNKDSNPTQALVHLQNKLRYEEEVKTNVDRLSELAKSENSMTRAYGAWYRANVTNVEQSNTLTVKTLSDQYKAAIADKQAKLDDLDKKVKAADADIKAKERENAQLQPTAQELKDAADAERVKQKLDADKAALEKAKQDLALNDLRNVGRNAISVGNNSLVTGTNAIGIGTDGLITGEDAIGIGRANTITGTKSVALGTNNSIQSNNAFAIGNNINITTGFDNAVVIGHNSAPKAPTAVDGVTPEATVSFGSPGHERQLVNVAKGALTETSTDAINGAQLYSVKNDLLTEINKKGAAVKVIDGQNTTVTEGTDGNIATYAVNVSTDAIKDAVQADLDAKANKDASNLTGSDVTKWQEKLGNGTVEAGNTGLTTGDTVYNATKDLANKDLSNITKDGETVIKNLAGEAVKVAEGTNVTITSETKDGTTTYTVNAVGNGKVVQGDTGLVTGDTVYKELDKTNNAINNKADTDLGNITDDGKTVIRDLAKGSVKVIDGQNTTVTTGVDGDATTYAVNVSADAIKGAVQADLDAKANKDASNLTGSDVTKWQEKLGNGTVEAGNTGLTTGDTVYNATKDLANKDLSNITKDGETVIKNLAGEAVKVAEGTNVTVTSETKDSTTTYTVNAVGNGKVAAGDTGLVTGDTVYKELDKTNNAINNKADTDLGNITDDGKTVIRDLAKGSVKVVNGENTTVTTGVDGNATTYAVNVSTDTIKGAIQPELDKKANTDASNLTGGDVTKWQEKLGNGTVEAGNTGLTTGDTVYNATKDLANKDLSNITDGGKTVIRDVAKGSVKVVNGENTTVTTGVDGDATTYAVNVSTDTIKGAIQPELDKKANTDASNLTNSDIKKWQDALGNGSVEQGNTGLVTGDTVYNVVKNVAGNPLAVSYDSSDKDVITLKGTEGTIISNVKNGEVAAGSMDAVNGGQLYETNTRIDQAVGRLSSDIKHVGAVSAALAGLHPQDFDEDYKFTVAAARGSYDGANAYALGAFYRPNSDLMFNVASTLSSGKKAYTMGVSYKFGTSNKKSVLAENAALQDKVNRLEQVVNTIANSPLFQLKDARKPFPDVPRDRWDAKAVETLHANGIVEGYPDGTYKGEETMTRSEYAQMVYALADKLTQPNK